MKRFAKKLKAGDTLAVSAVIGVILMVAITVAIAAVVYVYTMGLVTSSGMTPAPTLSFIKEEHKLIVAKSDGELLWSDVTIVNASTDQIFLNNRSSIVQPGDTIEGIDFDISIIVGNTLLANFDFQ